MEKEIGGYFGLELNKGNEYHKNAIKLNTGRNCLEYILITRNYDKIYIPYYTCEVIMEPINKLGILYEFYHIDEQLNPLLTKDIKTNEVLLYTNYFGIKNKEVRKLSHQIKNLIIDNSQSFYTKPINNIDTFYSARKFFGVPDGAYLYTNSLLKEQFEQDESYTRFSHLLKRIDLNASMGYNDFKINDHILSGQPIKKMSKLTNAILCNINYNNIRSIRRTNFQYFHSTFKQINKLQIDIKYIDSPMVYPLLLDKSLRDLLIKHKVYIAKYWPNVIEWTEKESFEYHLSENLLCIPIDQRIEIQDCNQIINLILNYEDYFKAIED